MSGTIEQSIREVLAEGKLKVSEPMKNHTTFRVGGPAQYYAAPDREELARLLACVKEHGIPLTVIGNGSNLLVGDKGIRGLVIEIGGAMDRVCIQGTQMTVGAGTILAKAAGMAADQGLSGLEFAAGIPGSLGGAVVMNAGAYGGEMKDVLVSATVLTSEGQVKTLTVEELDLGYRHSCIREKNYIVVEAVVQLREKPVDEIRALMAELREKRVSKQPLEYPSAGSTFKRPEGYFAGKLIEDAGLRGYQVGGAQVSEKHCGFVINRGNATAAEIRQLICDVQHKVYEQFQVRLEPEVRLLGDF